MEIVQVVAALAMMVASLLSLYWSLWYSPRRRRQEVMQKMRAQHNPPTRPIWQELNERATRRGKRRGISKSLRMDIFERDGFRCQYCGRTIQDGIKLHVDHKVAVANGGTNDIDNLVTSCDECNCGKSDKELRLPEHISIPESSIGG